MSESPITLQEFQDILDRCGPDPVAWPEDRRTAAEAFAAGSVEARARLDAAIALKRALGPSADVPEAKAPPGLKERILKAAKDSPSGE